MLGPQTAVPGHPWGPHGQPSGGHGHPWGTGQRVCCGEAGLARGLVLSAFLVVDEDRSVLSPPPGTQGATSFHIRSTGLDYVTPGDVAAEDRTRAPHEVQVTLGRVHASPPAERSGWSAQTFAGGRRLAV